MSYFSKTIRMSFDQTWLLPCVLYGYRKRLLYKQVKIHIVDFKYFCCIVFAFICFLEYEKVLRDKKMGITAYAHTINKFAWLRNICSDIQERFCSMNLAIYLLNNLRQEFETIVVYFIVLSKHVPRENEENHDILFCSWLNKYAC